MRKKYLIALLALACSSNLFANVVTKEITQRSLQSSENPSVNWSIDHAGDTYFITNATSNIMDVFISVNKLRSSYSSPVVSQTTAVNCQGKVIKVFPGSSVVCEVQPNANAQISLQEEYKTGTDGVYSVIKN